MLKPEDLSKIKAIVDAVSNLVEKLLIQPLDTKQVVQSRHLAMQVGKATDLKQEVTDEGQFHRITITISHEDDAILEEFFKDSLYVVMTMHLIGPRAKPKVTKKGKNVSFSFNVSQ